MSHQPINMRAGLTKQQEDRISFNRQSIVALLDHAGWRVLREGIEERAGFLRQQILGGKLDADLYRSYTGELQGLERVVSIAQRLAESGQAEEAPSNGDT